MTLAKTGHRGGESGQREFEGKRDKTKIKDTQTLPRAHIASDLYYIRYGDMFFVEFSYGDSVSRVKSSDLYATNSHTKTLYGGAPKRPAMIL